MKKINKKVLITALVVLTIAILAIPLLFLLPKQRNQTPVVYDLTFSEANYTHEQIPVIGTSNKDKMPEILTAVGDNSNTATSTASGQRMVDTYTQSFCAMPEVVKDGKSPVQNVCVYVPQNATKDSPILISLVNSGWRSNSFVDANEQMRLYLLGEYNNETGSLILRAIEEGYVVVIVGARERGSTNETDGTFSHSPDTIVDAKAVIRYLRLNQNNLPAGDTDKIIVVGASGGGGLAAILGASGDSPDYYEGLYEIGAAGITKNEDGSYTSTISDAVWAVVACCPIADFKYADGAYEWTFAKVRERLYEDNITTSYSSIPKTTILQASSELKQAFSETVDGLGLIRTNGTPLTSDNFDDAITELICFSLNPVVKFGNKEQLEEVISSQDYSNSWLMITDNEHYQFNLNEFLYFTARNGYLKHAPAFSNYGLNYGKIRNEDNLFGLRTYEYSPFNKYSWNNDSIPNAVGQDDTDTTWDEYLKTPQGEKLEQQLRMTGTIDYLLDKENGTTAPHWYIRCGMIDTDSSVALETLRYLALWNDNSVENLYFAYTFLEGHNANYDNDEIFTWLNEKH